jgi:hypothetical protein
MDVLQAGDIVRVIDSEHEMILIGQDFDTPSDPERIWLCAWDRGGQLYQQIFPESRLIIVRKERRRIPRAGALPIPVHFDAGPPPLDGSHDLTV